MRKLPLIVGIAALGGVVSLVSKRLRPPLAPEGEWKDLATKPSSNGLHPD